MFQKLVNHNDDLRRLLEKGYAVAIDPGFLIVRDIPYLGADKTLRRGSFVTKLVFKDADHFQQEDHQIFFAGGVPHGLDGNPIPNLGGGEASIKLSDTHEDVVVERSFSNKPKSGAFVDFFEKIESYVTIISGPAMELHGANPLTYRVVEAMPESVFKFHDTLSSRAEITDLARNFSEEVIAIIGLGGTGAYVLDLMIKTPVREIRGFDHDQFHVHTAFRSPGRLEESEFGLGKVDVYQGRYEGFRQGVKLERKFIDETSGDMFDSVTFAFVCVDKGTSRAAIFDLLIRLGIPYIDVGMGLDRKQGAINGLLRTTYYSEENAGAVREMKLATLADNPDNIYKTNIQIAELNALNASLAVIKYKQILGFYQEDEAPFHLLFGIGDMKAYADREH